MYLFSHYYKYTYMNKGKSVFLYMLRFCSKTTENLSLFYHNVCNARFSRTSPLCLFLFCRVGG